VLLLSIPEPICTRPKFPHFFPSLHVGTQFILTVTHAITLAHFLILSAKVLCPYVTYPRSPFTFPTVSHPNTKVQRQPTNVSMPASSSRHGRHKPTTRLCRTVPHTTRCGCAARPTGQDVGDSVSRVPGLGRCWKDRGKPRIGKMFRKDDVRILGFGQSLSN
jgi:hypothetical protein